MLVTAATRYGVRAIFDLAFYGNGQPTKIRDVSLRQCISERYLEQIFYKLLKAGLLKGKRGPKGGYILAKDASHITVADIIHAVEGPVSPVPVKCLSSDEEESKSCRIQERCIARHVWRRTEALLRDYYTSVSIADLCSLARIEGIPRLDEDSVLL